MEMWRVLALAAAAAMIAGPAFAQSAGSGATPQMEQSPSPSDRMKSDTMTSDPSKANRTWRMGNRGQVKAAQEALRQKGFDPGPTDGMMGPKTQAALKDFQRAERINETGRLDAETMAKLGVPAGADAASPAASPRMGDPSRERSSTSKDPTVPGPSDIRKKQTQ